MSTHNDMVHRLGNHSVPGVGRVPWWDHEGRDRLARKLVASGLLDTFVQVMDPRPELNTSPSSDIAEESA